MTSLKTLIILIDSIKIEAVERKKGTKPAF